MIDWTEELFMQIEAFSASEEQVSLTLLHYDEQMKNERYLLFYGHLTETGNEWIFTPSHVVLPRWGRRA